MVPGAAQLIYTLQFPWKFEHISGTEQTPVGEVGLWFFVGSYPW